MISTICLAIAFSSLVVIAWCIISKDENDCQCTYKEHFKCKRYKDCECDGK